jgi:hypothetical protein
MDLLVLTFAKLEHRGRGGAILRRKVAALFAHRRQRRYLFLRPAVCRAISAQPTARLPQLVVTTGVLQATGEELPLAVSIRGASDGAALVINRLPEGSTLSTGHPLGTNSWHLPTADLGDSVHRPPRGFVGRMNLALELHLVDDTIADRQFLHVEWAGTPIEAAQGVALSPSAGTAGIESPPALSARARRRR